MRALNWILAAASVFFIARSPCAAQVRTDAQADGLTGPVKSVLSITFRPGISWSQPSGVALVLPIGCEECDYDPDGARIRSGQRYNDGFHGDNILLTRDPQGHVIDRRLVDAATGELKLHDTLGPFGITERTIYQQGKVTSSETFQYDSLGHVSETSTVDGNGRQTEHTHTTYTEKGVLTEDRVWGQNGQLKWQQLFDPKANTQSMTTFDGTGAVQLAWTRKDNKLTSFWERSDEPNQFGDCQTKNEQDGAQVTRCYANGDRERAVIRYQYTDPKSRTVKSAEWRDGSGKLLYAAYYEYQFDSRGNWSHRTISVISPELPDRTLYEDDTRYLTYWGT